MQPPQQPAAPMPSTTPVPRPHPPDMLPQLECEVGWSVRLFGHGLQWGVCGGVGGSRVQAGTSSSAGQAACPLSATPTATQHWAQWRTHLDGVQAHPRLHQQQHLVAVLAAAGQLQHIRLRGAARGRGRGRGEWGARRQAGNPAGRFHGITGRAKQRPFPCLPACPTAPRLARPALGVMSYTLATRMPRQRARRHAHSAATSALEKRCLTMVPGARWPTAA